MCATANNSADCSLPRWNSVIFRWFAAVLSKALVGAWRQSPDWLSLRVIVRARRLVSCFFCRAYTEKAIPSPPHCICIWLMIFAQVSWFELVDMAHKLILTSLLAFFPSDYEMPIGMVTLRFVVFAINKTNVCVVGHCCCIHYLVVGSQALHSQGRRSPAYVRANRAVSVHARWLHYVSRSQLNTIARNGFPLVW